jgi:uncharacterized protein (TIGR02246 family)
MAKSGSAASVSDLHAKFEYLFNAGDLDGLVRLYEPDAILNPAPGHPVQGTQAIREALQGFLAVGGKISLKTTTVFETSGGIALAHGEYTIKGGSTDISGKSAEVLRKQPDGSWLFVIDDPSA